MFPTPARRADVKKRNVAATPLSLDPFISPAPGVRPPKAMVNSPIPMAPLGARTPAPRFANSKFLTGTLQALDCDLN
jgi:hypothetical protein